MRKIYSIIFLVAAGLVMATEVSSCFKNEDDITGPKLTIDSPIENDTIHLNKDSFIHIHAVAQDKDNRSVTFMYLELINLESNNHLFTDTDTTNKQIFTCDEYIHTEEIYPRIDKLTHLTLKVRAINDINSFNTKNVSFYVKP
jgi:hypothetical protein